MKNILVALDLNDKEQKLIDQAEQLAQAFNAKIWLMHIAAPDPDFVGYEVGPQYIRDERASELRKEHRQIQAYTDQLIAKGHKAEGLLIQGATIEMIIEESEKLKTELIIAGHVKQGFFYNAFIGSTSSEIIKQSNIAVLIVPLD